MKADDPQSEPRSPAKESASWWGRRWVRRLLWTTGVVIGAITPLFIGRWLYCGRHYPVHQHCSKAAGGMLGSYAMDHNGRFPEHTNGFGDALLLLAEGQEANVPFLTAARDDGDYYRQALRTGGDVPEHRCSRMYIQGLGSTNWGVAVMFDRYPTAGGDHFRRPCGPLMREVIMADSSVRFIPETSWTAFAREQVNLLVKLGFPRGQAEEFYKPFPGPVPKER